MNKTFLWLAIIVVLLSILPIAPVQAVPPSQADAPRRGPDLIRELYEGDPAQHLLEGVLVEPPLVRESSVTATPPVGTRLAYESYKDNNWDVYLVDPDGRNNVRLTEDTSIEVDPTLRPDSQQVLFSSNRSGDYDLYLIDVDGTKLRRLTNDPSNDVLPAWSPDRTKIAFQSTRTGNSDIFVMDADGSHVTQLTDFPGFDGHPSWSPDGKRIVFSSKRTGYYALWIMDADGSNLYQVTYDANALYPAWSPKGDKIAYSNDEDGDGYLEIYLISLYGYNRYPEEFLGDLIQTDRWGPAWSPDGEWLAYTQTSWKYYQGNWYWTRSYVYTISVTAGGDTELVPDDRAWKIHWAWDDATSPGPCTVTVAPEQRWSSFIVQFSAVDDNSGVGSYDLQVRDRADSGWQDGLTNVSMPSAIFQSNEMGDLDMRCRARDRAGNLGSWDLGTVSSTNVDAVLPWSQASCFEHYTPASFATVRWTGYDLGGGISGYDVFVRDGTEGDWELWQDGVTATSAEFSGIPGHTYYFRSQAHDTFGHTQPWEPVPQAEVTFYTNILSGTITDDRGHTIAIPQVDVTPESVASLVGISSGLYQLYLSQAIPHKLSITTPGYGTLPSATISMGGDTRFDWVMPPHSEEIVNGGFESGDLVGWGINGVGAQVISDVIHTGSYALEMEQETSGNVEVSQTVSIDGDYHQPTLSFLYNIPADLEGGVFSVLLTGPVTTTVFSTSLATPGWQHAWADLSGYAGGDVKLVIQLVATGTVHLDEVSIGSWETPQVHIVSPTHWYDPETHMLMIEGENFIDLPEVYLGEMALSNVAWVSDTLLTADIPGGLGAGWYDLRVVNPGGAAFVLPDAVAVNSHYQVLLPVVFNSFSNLDRFPEDAGWPTLGYDIAHTGYHQNDQGASRYALAWSRVLPYPNTDVGFEQVVVTDGILVAANDNRFGSSGIVAYDAETGVELWRYPFSNIYSVNPPSVAHGAVYFQQVNEYHDTFLFCLDLDTGEKYWQVPLPFSAKWRRYLAPVVVDQMVFILDGYGGLYGFDAGRGDKLWDVFWSVDMETMGKWTPAYLDGKLYSWVQGTFRVHDIATGLIQWYLDVDPQAQGMNTAPVLVKRTALLASPIVLTAIDLDLRLEKWSLPGNFDNTIPAVAGNVVYALNDGTLEALRFSDGVLLWSFDGDGGLKNAPLVAGNYVYVASDENTYVLDRTTHQLVWQTDRGGWLTVANGFLYIAQQDKTIYAYRAQEP